MRSRRLKRLLCSLAAVVALLAAVYLLRWPLFGRLIQGRLEALARENLKSGIRMGDLSGSLLTGIEISDVTLHPSEGSDVKEARVNRVSVRYGFLGSADPTVVVEGARFVLAESPGPEKPITETIRDIVHALQNFRIDGTIEVSDSTLVLADGRIIEVIRAQVNGALWTAEGRTEGFGRIQASATFGADGTFQCSGDPTEGPVREIRASRKAENQMEITARVGGEPMAWKGRCSVDDSGRLASLAGTVTASQGSAELRLDMKTGRVTAEGNLRHAVREDEFFAEFDIRGKAEGFVEGPLEDWVFHSIDARADVSRLGSLEFDELNVECSRATPSELTLRAKGRRGRDHAEAEGTLALKPALAFQGRIRAAVETLDPYVPAELSLKASQIEVQGTMSASRDRFDFEGTVQAGPGSFHGETWGGLHFAGSLKGSELIAERVRIVGSRWTAELEAKGRGSYAADLLTLRDVQITAGQDRLKVHGELHGTTRFTGVLELEGAGDWLRALGVAPIGPVELKGKVESVREGMQFSGSARFGDARSEPTVFLASRPEGWFVEFQPGQVDITGDAPVTHQGLAMTLGVDSIQFSARRLEYSPARARTDAKGAVRFPPGSIDVEVECERVHIEGRDLPALHLRSRSKKDEHEIEFNWGQLVHASGKIGKTIEGRASIHTGDLETSFISDLLQVKALRGSATLELVVSGSIDRPDVRGSLRLAGIAIEGEEPIHAVIPLKSESDRLTIPETDIATAYGTITLQGVLPQPWVDWKAPLDLRAQIEVIRIASLAHRLPVTLQPYVPGGKLFLTAQLHGPIHELKGRVDADFEGEDLILPPPLGSVKGLRARAAFHAGGLEVISVTGTLGGGEFHGTGEWKVGEEGRPLAIRLRGRELLVVDRELTRLRVDPEVTLSARDGEPVWIRGQVGIPLLVHYSELGSPSGSSQARRVSAPGFRLIPSGEGGFRIAGIAGLDDVRMDLKVLASGEIRIENSLIGVLLKGEGRIRGKPSEPAFSGRLQALSGEVRLGLGMFVRIESAVLDLPEERGKDPTINFEGRVGQGESLIRAYVSGPLQSPHLKLESDRPRSQEELLASLAFGRAPGTFETEDVLAPIAGKIVDWYTDDWPKAEPEEGFFDRLRFGLSQDRPASPSVGSAAGTPRGVTVRTEYFLTPAFSIVAETDRESNVSGDVKFRLRFR